MAEVHILIWCGAGRRIGAVYADYDRAQAVADKSNKERSYWERITAGVTGEARRWRVETFEVKT